VNVIVLFNIIAFFSFSCAVFKLAGNKKHLRLTASEYYPLLLSCCVYSFITLSNVFEHAEISSVFDPFEDVGELVFLFMCLFFINNWKTQRSLEELQKKESALNEALATITDKEKQYRQLIESANESILIIQDAKIVYCNSRTTELLSLSYQEMSTKAFVEFIHPDDRELVLTNYQRRLRGEDFDSTYVLRIINAAGKHLIVQISTVLVEWNNKPATLSFVRDITDQVKLEQSVYRIQKMEAIGNLAGGIAHDFNNMLGVILGHVELAIMTLPEGNPLVRNLTTIRDAANRSSELTKQLLAFARRQPTSLQSLNLNAVIENMLNMLHRLIGEDIELVWVPGEDLGLIRMDPSQIDQLLINLCVNSRDAIDGTGKITIQTQLITIENEHHASHFCIPPGKYVQLQVSDNGCGMDEETMSHLFEPFFTTKELGKGTGLGLATVYGIVNQNYGYIDVSSTPGENTTFTIYVPSSEDSLTTKFEGEKPAPHARGHETILLVEDEPMLNELTKTILENLGYSVLTATSPEMAISMESDYSGQIDLLLTDVIMPKMNGRDLAAKIEAHNPRLKTIFISGYTDDVIVQHGVLDKDVNFIQKPASMKDIASKVRTVLDSAA